MEALVISPVTFCFVTCCGLNGVPHKDLSQVLACGLCECGLLPRKGPRVDECIRHRNTHRRGGRGKVGDRDSKDKATSKSTGATRT